MTEHVKHKMPAFWPSPWNGEKLFTKTATHTLSAAYIFLFFLLFFFLNQETLSLGFGKKKKKRFLSNILFPNKDFSQKFVWAERCISRSILWAAPVTEAPCRGAPNHIGRQRCALWFPAVVWAWPGAIRAGKVTLCTRITFVHKKVHVFNLIFEFKWIQFFSPQHTFQTEKLWGSGKSGKTESCLTRADKRESKRPCSNKFSRLHWQLARHAR